MKLTGIEQNIVHQALEILASQVESKQDEGKVLVLDETSYQYLQQILSPTTVVLSEKLADTHVEANVTVMDAIHKVQESEGSLTADYHSIEAESFVHFVKEVGHPLVDYVVEKYQGI